MQIQLSCQHEVRDGVKNCGEYSLKRNMEKYKVNTRFELFLAKNKDRLCSLFRRATPGKKKK